MKAKQRTGRNRKTYPAGKADLHPGEVRIVEITGKSIGIFNISGRFFALLNRCPHMGGRLCEGPVTGTTLPAEGFEYTYGRVGEVIRCAWHGWEFDIASGRSLVDPKMQVRTYPVSEENGILYVHI